MNKFRADLHIHTVLSPCADLEMSPSKIVAAARKKQLDMIGITDHNHTGNCRIACKIGAEAGITVLMGAEITTREEIHCLVLLPDADKISMMQEWIDQSILKIPHNPAKFGYQLMVDENEMITGEADYYLGTALSCSIEELEQQVQELEGIFIPAHIDRGKNSIYSQLGFIPPDLKHDAFEISARTNRLSMLTLHPELAGECLIGNSDAHILEQVGYNPSCYEMENCSFEELRKALHSLEGRKVIA